MSLNSSSSAASSSDGPLNLYPTASLRHGFKRTKAQLQHKVPGSRIQVDRISQMVAYHLYSIWLFTYSDIKTIVVPSLLFAVFTAPALAAFGISSGLPFTELAGRAPTVLFWVWVNLLPFTIDNQRREDSIAEDALNKPWRTMPSRRMSPTQARTLMFCLYFVAMITSYRVGGLEQCLSLIALGTWYNDFRGGDGSCVVRNLINAAGFNRFTTGALKVLLSGRQPHTPLLLVWQAIIAGIVFSTVQTQDMYDQLGDAERGRRTVPLVIGDAWGRWSIAVPMVFWSIFCPVFIGAPLVGLVLSVGLGGLIAARSLLFRSVAEDKKTFILWNLWLVCIYLQPLLRVAYGKMEYI